MKPLDIAIRLIGLGTLTGQRGFVQGDELMARGWVKYLRRRNDVARVRLYGPQDRLDGRHDFAIHFYPMTQAEDGVRTLLYLQNAFAPEEWQGGTVGVFRQVRHVYAGFIYPSEILRTACREWGAVVPFATDPELFRPVRVAQQYAVSFVGNNIRSAEHSARFLEPALAHGLALYGGGWECTPYEGACRGKLPVHEVPGVACASAVNLNLHIEEHARNGVVNMRVFDALACGAFVLSDPHEEMTRILGDAVPTTQGGDAMTEDLARWLAEPNERWRRVQAGRECVLAGHTYAHRAEALVRCLREF